MAGGSVSMPPLPTWSAETVNLGHVTIGQQSDIATVVLKHPGRPQLPPLVWETNPALQFVTGTMTFEEVQNSVDFAILTPTWLPTADYTQQSAWVIGDAVFLDYQDRSSQPWKTITIQEQPWATSDPEFFAPGPVTEGDIAGQTAAFWTANQVQLPPPLLSPNGAAWEDGNLLILLGSIGGLSQDDLSQVGASLTETASGS